TCRRVRRSRAMSAGDPAMMRLRSCGTPRFSNRKTWYAMRLRCGAPGRVNYTVVGDNGEWRRSTGATRQGDRPEQGCGLLVSGETGETAGSGFAFEDAGVFDTWGRESQLSIKRLLS
ncbi:MAG: hypothetical protein OSB69_15800, partial [Alphaproteobacteria bacterium]|nr:hypothetical protein [Alphaproteobacteria bacterium]